MFVSITGADDAVNPADLISLSEDYPHVEWAILRSNTREGSARYPSEAWRKRFFSAVAAHDDNGTKVHTAEHWCGSAMKQFLQGARHDQSAMRHQLNGYRTGTVDFEMLARDVPERFRRGLILQARDAHQLAGCILDANALTCAGGWDGSPVTYSGHGPAVLFDPSGGTGRSVIELLSNTVARLVVPTRIKIGMAGGIGPDCITEAVRMASLMGFSWIDMESQVRTDDQLDLQKVEAVLSAVGMLTAEP